MVKAADLSKSQEERYTHNMSKNYGTVSEAFSIPQEISSVSNRINNIVLSAAANVGIDVSQSNILDVGCGQGGNE